MASLNGKWQLTGSEGFDKYMQTIGVTDENRAKGKDILEKAGPGGLVEEYVIESGKSIKRNIYIGGQLLRESKAAPFNTEVTGPSLDGRTAKITLTENGSTKVTRHETFENGLQATTVSEVKGDELHTTLTCSGVVSKRVYKKV